MEERPVIAIEHLEEGLSPWILLEYRHSSIIIGRDRLWFTNVPRRYHSILARYGCVFEESVLDLIDHSRLLILDPVARVRLSTKDLDNVDAIVIGGILGDHPPRRRTYKYLSSRAPDSLKRNIGEGQYSIDGAVYVVREFLRRGCIDCIEYVDGVRIESIENGVKCIIELPFRYPLVKGIPLIAPGLREYLLHRRLPNWLLKEFLSK